VTFEHFSQAVDHFGREGERTPFIQQLRRGPHDKPRERKWISHVRRTVQRDKRTLSGVRGEGFPNLARLVRKCQGVIGLGGMGELCQGKDAAGATLRDGSNDPHDAGELGERENFVVSDKQRRRISKLADNVNEHRVALAKRLPNVGERTLDLGEGAPFAPD
jgi:hypothetical protein